MKRAIGIVRVSEVAGREGERFTSPAEQRDRIKVACERDGLELVAIHEELDVSGGGSLEKRPGLSQAVASIEAGEAEVIIAAYFDRLFRSIKTQTKVIERVEAVGGRMLALDVGNITNGTAAEWLSGTMHGMMAEYLRRQIGEKSGAAQARAVARGAVPFPIPPGYRRRQDGTAEVDSKTAPLVVQAWRMRADKASLPVIRRWLSQNGIKISLGGLNNLLSNRFYLGELHYRREGVVPNLTAHEPIISRDLFERVQRTKGTLRGRTSKSPHLLARLGVLRCGACGGRMSVTHKGNQGRKVPIAFYRCTSTNCDRRQTISATIAEELITSTVKVALQDAQGRASMAENAQEVAGALTVAQAGLDAALRVLTLTGAENEPAAVERIAELRQARDDAQARVDQIGPAASRVVNTEDCSFDEWRDLIRATVESAIVAPGGRGAERITVNFFGQ